MEFQTKAPNIIITIAKAKYDVLQLKDKLYILKELQKFVTTERKLLNKNK